jgi:hypothetical protein
MAESDLYLPVKRLLEGQGYEVKAEVRNCDVVAARNDEPLVIVELKQALSLQLFYQAVDRLALTPSVYVAVPRPKRGIPREAVKLCRRLGLGLIVVAASGATDILADPVPYAPRASAKRAHLLLKEFRSRKGDPNIGGVSGRSIMTAYRQDAIACATHLRERGSARPRDIAAATGIARAANILRDNHYGWFARVERGVYALAEGFSI